MQNQQSGDPVMVLEKAKRRVAMRRYLLFFMRLVLILMRKMTATSVVMVRGVNSLALSSK